MHRIPESRGWSAARIPGYLCALARGANYLYRVQGKQASKVSATTEGVDQEIK